MPNTRKIRALSEWNKVKGEVHSIGHIPSIREGEVWWCTVGENVGVEINGKGNKFLRPVIVFRKLSEIGFLGVPLTSQKHVGSWYVHFMLKDKQQIAVLSQIKVFSVFRLYRKMGMLPKDDLKIIEEAFWDLYK